LGIAVNGVGAISCVISFPAWAFPTYAPRNPPGFEDLIDELALRVDAFEWGVALPQSFVAKVLSPQ
jgi:hypothetical protein